MSSSSYGSQVDTRMRVILALLVIVIVAAISIAVVKIVANSDSGSNPEASTELLNKLTTIPDSAATAVGLGSAKNLPIPIANPQDYSKDGKTRILYAGAEFCPYCATERWPMVVALSRFGKFSNLKLTHSATADVFPNTQTFSFHGSSYSSDYLIFEGVETLSNKPSGNSYEPLDSLTDEQQAIVSTFDSAPYVAAQSAGSIPFLYFGGKYLTNGSAYDPGTLQGKSADDIANALTDTNSAIAQGVIGTANSITAAICSLTNNQPSTVCTLPVIQTLQTQINAQTAVGAK